MTYQAMGLVRGLDMKAPLKPILMAYANYADELGYVWEGVDTIVFDTGYSITAVKDARKTLISDGWMASKRRFGASSIVRLNLELMSSNQVDRREHQRTRPELEFAEKPRSATVSRETAEREPRDEKTAGQTRRAVRRPNGHGGPSDGFSNSRETANQTAASRPTAPIDREREGEEPFQGSSPDRSKAAPPGAAGPDAAAPEHEDRVRRLVRRFPWHARDCRPTVPEVDAIVQSIVTAVGKHGLTFEQVQQHGLAALKRAKGRPPSYVANAFADKHIQAIFLEPLVDVEDMLPLPEDPEPAASDSAAAAGESVATRVPAPSADPGGLPAWCRQCGLHHGDDRAASNAKFRAVLDPVSGVERLCRECHPSSKDRQPNTLVGAGVE